ncbi:MAG: adenylate cyclase [Desulfobacteraceae bacterium]|nr:MAG: adenylate cyclase [Desulfobacteraceae bacterium]
MTTQGFDRKLSAILSADVAGYSRLMSADEEATVRTLTAYRALIEELAIRHKGRIVDSPGDNILVEFVSVVHAVECGFAFQAALITENAKLPDDRRMQFRIGINLGDVLQEGPRIYGDGVNIAARMESLAAAGGICISGVVYDQIENKLAFGCEYLGEQKVKNIITPIRVYKIWEDPSKPGCRGKARLVRPPKRIAPVAVVLILGFMAGGIWLFDLPRKSANPPLESGDARPSATHAAARASIAVLPFKNLSGDKEQEYFSDGLTDDIITDLSKFHELLVIASEAVFKYKLQADRIERIGKEMDVRYVLEGSVQKADEKVRINVRLVDTVSHNLVWTERYVRDLQNIFELQNEIVQMIVSNLAVNLSSAERSRVRPKTDNLAAYDYLLKGYSFHHERTLAANIKATEMFEQAISLDPGYAAAYIGLGKVEYEKVIFGWTEFPEKTLDRAREFAQKALSLDDADAAGHHLLARTFAAQAEYEKALSELQRAIELNPNDADSYEARGWIMLWSGNTGAAIDSLRFALRLGSKQKTALLHLGTAYFLKGKYDDAIQTLEHGLHQWPDLSGYHIILSAAYAQTGRMDAAARAAQSAQRLEPFFDLEDYGRAFRNPMDRQKIINGLRKAFVLVSGK